jgi:hypothetical protein
LFKKKNLYSQIRMNTKKCARPECNFDKHPNPKNNGGEHCCNSCKLTGVHGPACKGELLKAPQNTIVISHYKSKRFEDLLLFFQEDNIIVYDKSGKYDSDEFKNIIILENKGREGETYLNHILRNYNNLSYYTLFIQDDTENHILSYPRFKEETDRVISENIKFYQYPTSWKLGEAVQKKRVIVNGTYPLHTFPSQDSIKEACERLDIVLPSKYSTETGAFFIVHKDLILKRSRAFYEKLCAWLLENSKNGFVLEHMWPIIFPH